MDLKGTKLTDPFTEESVFCMEKDDIRLQPMCCHFLSDSPCDVLLGAEECTSPFGTYEISLPIDSKTPCAGSDTRLTNKNCKDFNVSIVWHANTFINVTPMNYLSKTPLMKYYSTKLIECKNNSNTKTLLKERLSLANDSIRDAGVQVV